MSDLTTNDVVVRHLATASGDLETALILARRLDATNPDARVFREWAVGRIEKAQQSVRDLVVAL